MQGAFGRNRVGRLFRKGGNEHKKRCEKGIKRISGRRGGWGWCEKQSFSRKCVELHHENAFFHSTMRDIILCYHVIMSDILFIFFLFAPRRNSLSDNFSLFSGTGKKQGLVRAPRARVFFFQIQFNENVFCIFSHSCRCGFLHGNVRIVL